MNTPDGKTAGQTIKGERPIYASKIRELRKFAKLTQPEFAEKLGVKRGAVAQWEGGTREPRYRNYEALAAFADSQNLVKFGTFFRNRRGLKELNLRRKRKDQDDAAYAERYLRLIEQNAALGDKHARDLLALSRLGQREYQQRLLASISRGIRAVKGWGFTKLLSNFSDQAGNVEAIRLAYELRSLELAEGQANGPK